MASKKKTENQLDSYRVELASFEDLVRKQERLNAELKVLGGLIEDRRKKLMLSAADPKAERSAPSTLEASSLKGQDPRIRRSLGELLNAMRRLGGSVKSAEISKALGISQKAAQLRLYRARKLGLVRSVSLGNYAIKT
jgi:hypothetical protein